MNWIARIAPQDRSQKHSSRTTQRGSGLIDKRAVEVIAYLVINRRNERSTLLPGQGLHLLSWASAGVNQLELPEWHFLAA
ncbi:hypothetical protein [Synechococcus sp. MIT S9503]|uniref:hypothetical protein n=1 Tax=Synechococcus sp. MIT S9503 TaxID=3082547 RepID=UPI0039A6A48D